MIIAILKKYWAQLGLIITIILLCLSVRQCQVNSSAVSLLSQTSDSVRYYRAKNGDMVAQIQSKEVTINELKKFGGQLGFDKKQLEQQVGRLNNLVAHWKGKVGMKDTITITLRDTVITEVDGVEDNEQTFAWDNKYLFLDGVINDGKLSLDYKYNAEFTVTAYYKRRNLFNKDLMTDVSFKDKNMVVTEFKGLVVKPPKKTFWQTTTGKVLIGFGAGMVTYAIIK